MHITLNDTAYVSNLFQRDFYTIEGDQSAWDLCMENTTCKTLSIVGIVMGSLTMLWFLLAVCLVCFLGVSCFNAMFCGGCGNSNRKDDEMHQQQQVHHGNYYAQNPPMNMYPPSQGMQQRQMPVQGSPGSIAVSQNATTHLTGNLSEINQPKSSQQTSTPSVPYVPASEQSTVYLAAPAEPAVSFPPTSQQAEPKPT
ncbi:hypothetical protein HF325_004688 [Metschnikowia pulcherrima]|uniref:Uncharacterized protein n=1 Tax=Metschnikowia pulcherrima TaxID=27326 RepID=A0A8H7LA86_9ASCO|nr:hypothetical protein HF325_004688 [Metschnikowia pulcherrima]